MCSTMRALRVVTQCQSSRMGIRNGPTSASVLNCFTRPQARFVTNYRDLNTRITTASGLKYREITIGEGEQPSEGDTVQVHYTGHLEDGTKFDSSHDRGKPLAFQVGTGMVIRGWDEGILSMKVGGKRELVIPPELGYGIKGAGPIPSDATLTFECELVAIGEEPKSWLGSLFGK